MVWVWLAGLAWAGAYEDGVARLVKGDAAGARELLEAAVAADASHGAAWWELGWTRWVLGDFAGAAVAWEQAGAVDPGRTEAGFWIGAAQTRARWAQASPPVVEVALEPGDGPTLTVAAAGDTMLGSDLRGSTRVAPGDGADLLGAVAAPLRSADVGFLNLETTLADGLPSTKCGPQSTSCYAFRTPTRYVAALTGAGIDVVSHANNHAMDLGEAGMLSTAAALDGAGIAHAGRYGDVAYLQVDGRVVAVVAAHSGGCCLNVNELDDVQRAVAEADQRADLVLFSFHGGAEGSAARHVPGETEIAWGERRGDVTALAHAAIDAGADLVIGHGPHVLRAMEVYRGRLIAYSLGNFCGYRQFGTGGGYGGTTVIVEAELGSTGALVAARLVPVALDGQGVPQPDPSGLGLKHVAELSAADFPATGVQVTDDGTLSWGEAP